jgi:cellulose synthase operon protein B
MKKINLLIVLVLLMGLLTQPQIISHAQTETPGTPTPQPVSAEDPNFVSFQMMGQVDRVLHGPYASLRVRFSQPTSWKLLPGALLQLDLGAYFNQATLINSKGAALVVTFNGVLLSTVIIDWNGEHTVSIPIPDAALVSQRLDGRHELSLFLDASMDCRTSNQTTITLRSSSGFVLPHELVSPDTALAQLPHPFYQDSSFLLEPVTLVLPRDASAEEMQAALTVVAAFGRFSSGSLALPLVTSDFSGDKTAHDQLLQGHLIFVGKPGAFADLAQVQFPAPVKGGVVQAPAMQADDGVVEMSVSPWNKTRAVLYVGGNSDIGVVKAAQALSSGVLRASNLPNLTFISDVNASIDIPTPPMDRTLRDLGYQTADILSGYGISTSDYSFFVPPGMVAGQDAYINIVYSHSALLDFSRSGLVLFLNGNAIGSARFTEETAKSTNTLQVGLPVYALRPGNNRLTVEADLIPLDYCSDLINNGMWASIAPTTLIHLPLIPAQAQANVLPPDLSRYPYPFPAQPTLSNTAFVLAKDDLIGWSIAAGLAAELGKNASGELINFGAYFADAVPDEIRTGKDLILIGRATRLPLLDGISDKLPAPFPSGSDLAEERGLRVTYRLPEGTNLGYLQMFSSPWNEQNTILAVMGSTDLGLQWAGNVLVDPRWRSHLSGNFAVVNEQQVLTSDTRTSAGALSLSATAAPGAVPSFTETPAATVARPAWLLPGAIASGLMAVGLLLYVIISRRKKK